MTLSITTAFDKSKQQLMVRGQLTFETVNQAIEQSKSWSLDGLKELVLNLSGVKHCDSAGLALLVYWLKWARQNKLVLFFDEIPSQILALASASGLDKLLPQQPQS